MNVIAIKQVDHEQALSVALIDLYIARVVDKESLESLLERIEAVRVHCEALIGDRR